MAFDCLNPTFGWRIGTMRCKDGVVSPRITFSGKEAYDYWREFGFSGYEKSKIAVRCGKCINCRNAKKKELVTRIKHESSLYGEDQFFLTLTYKDEHLPSGASLRRSDIVDFIKRLRRYIDYHYGLKIKFFCSGEYGAKFDRPHYHLLIFGWSPDFSRCHIHSMHKGRPLFRSDEVEKLWTYGFSSFEPNADGVANYLAGYMTKKLLKPDPVGREPSFFSYSKSDGGLGCRFVDKYVDMFPRGYTGYMNRGRYTKVAIPLTYKRYVRKHKLQVFLDYRARVFQRVCAGDIIVLSMRDRLGLKERLENNIKFALDSEPAI